MNKYKIYLDGEEFTTFETKYKEELDILELFFRSNNAEVDYYYTDDNGKVFAKTWQGSYSVEELYVKIIHS